MKLTFSSQTDTGLVRENNEDVVVCDAAIGLCLVADGMGGYKAGEVASEMAATYFLTEMRRWLAQADQNLGLKHIHHKLKQCFHAANNAIFNAARASEQYEGMGTTLVAGVFYKRHLVLAHVGDSRCYRLRRGKMVQLTKDHTLIQEQLDAGLVTPMQAVNSVQRNLLTRALGAEEAILVDICNYEVRTGDLYLMCSDGLTDMVSCEEIAKILVHPSTLEHRVKSLTDMAKAHGGRDNITVLLSSVEGEIQKPGLIARWLAK
jgi:protein phosphatase